MGCFLRDGGLSFGQAKTPRQPVIDIHMHSESLGNLKSFGPNPVTDAKAPASVEEHVRQTLLMMGLMSCGVRSVGAETPSQFFHELEIAPLHYGVTVLHVSGLLPPGRCCGECLSIV